MSKFPLRKGGGAKGAGVVRQSRRARGRGSGHSRCNALGKAFRKSQDNPPGG